MLKRYRHFVGGTFRFVDATLIGIAWLLSYWLRFDVPLIKVTKGRPPFNKYAALLPLVIFLWAIVFSFFRVYQSRRMLRRTDEAWLLFRAHFASIVAFIVITYLFTEYRYSRVVMVYFGLVGAVFLVSMRLILRNLLRSIRKKGYNLRHVLAVGEGPSLEALIYRVDRFPELGLRFIGVLTSKNNLTKEIQGKSVIGHYEDLGQVLLEKHPDEILVALPQQNVPELDKILRQIRDETIDIRLVPDIHEYVTLGCEIEDFEGYPIVNLNHSPLEGRGVIFKRMTDFLLSFIGLVLLSPLLAILSIAVLLTSRGPVFYSQERMGLDGRTFRMLKFRSMAMDAEDKSGPVWAKKDDQRRTAFGTFLRKTSLDELPQLWNVLKGDMSLVGPRPERLFLDSSLLEGHTPI